MLPLLRVLAFVPMIVAIRIRGEERRLVASFHARGALDAARAVKVDAENQGAIARWMHQRLAAAGAIREASGGVYFDENGYSEFRARRRRRALVVLSLLVAAIVIAMLTGVVTP